MQYITNTHTETHIRSNSETHRNAHTLKKTHTPLLRAMGHSCKIMLKTGKQSGGLKERKAGKIESMFPDIPYTTYYKELW